ncbi:secreted protein [gut metagenome]|uniref:Secreted protein n=1 Tax=gut metagenome TaxID=749906 RepID=J9G3K4_9ZZZZ
MPASRIFFNASSAASAFFACSASRFCKISCFFVSASAPEALSANSAVASFISELISRREEFMLSQAARYSFSPVRLIDVLICSSFAIYIPPNTSSISTSFGTGLKRSGLNSR